VAWNDLKHKWERVSVRLKCPICNKEDGCLIAKDGTRVLCYHTPSDIYWSIGYLHKIPQDKVAELKKMINDSQDKQMVVRTKGRNAFVDFKALSEIYRREMSPKLIVELAQQLNVRPDALQRLGIGWSSNYCCYTFPMVNENFEVTGIQRRWTHGAQAVIENSRIGVFLPLGFRHEIDTTTFVTEGASDTAAALSMGLNAIGRYSASTCEDIICQYVEDHRVFIVSDYDPAGLHGATKLCEKLKDQATEAYVFTLPAGSPKIGDLRAWRAENGNTVTLRMLLLKCKRLVGDQT
jgi:hypothetical protein